MLYTKLNLHLWKKDHHYKNQFVENHAYCCRYFICLGWAGTVGHWGQLKLMVIFSKCCEWFKLDCEKFPNGSMITL